jgi:hypothetical protein
MVDLMLFRRVIYNSFGTEGLTAFEVIDCRTYVQSRRGLDQINKG